MSAPPPTRILITDIEAPERRLRRLRPEVVAELAKSMEEIGLLHPIVVTAKVKRGGFVLLAGKHRLEAARKLKWERIGASIAEELTADQELLAEIDENLARADLTPAEQAEHLAKRKEIHERVHPETKQGGAPGKAGGGKKAKTAKSATFAKEAGNKTGMAERTVRRAVQRAKAIPRDRRDHCFTFGREGGEDEIARSFRRYQRLEGKYPGWPLRIPRRALEDIPFLQLDGREFSIAELVAAGLWRRVDDRLFTVNHRENPNG